jgi:hypothetical protein
LPSDAAAGSARRAATAIIEYFMIFPFDVSGYSGKTNHDLLYSQYY